MLRNYELLEVDGETPKAKCLMCKAVVLPRNLSEVKTLAESRFISIKIVRISAFKTTF